MENYSPEDRAFYAFWYGHMRNELMQPPLSGVAHSEARYIWDAALATLASKDAEIARLREALEQALDDMGDDGYCVCPAAKDLMRAALTPQPTKE